MEVSRHQLDRAWHLHGELAKPKSDGSELYKCAFSGLCFPLLPFRHAREARNGKLPTS